MNITYGPVGGKLAMHDFEEGTTAVDVPDVNVGVDEDGKELYREVIVRRGGVDTVVEVDALSGYELKDGDTVLLTQNISAG